MKLIVDWHDYLVYDETSPSGLRWKVHRCNGKIKIGDVAGAKNKYKHWQFKYTLKGKTKSFYNHRTVYEMFNGPIKDGYVIDHIDGNSSNNRIDNLRVVTLNVNMRNQKQRNTNTTGVTGVSFDKRQNRYHAFWRGLDGKQVGRHFSVKKYGKDEAFHLACECRRNAIDQLNLKGAGYTERHG